MTARMRIAGVSGGAPEEILRRAPDYRVMVRDISFTGDTLRDKDCAYVVKRYPGKAPKASDKVCET